MTLSLLDLIFILCIFGAFFYRCRDVRNDGNKTRMWPRECRTESQQRV